MLVDCGDLSRLGTTRLLKVSRIFLSHCHIDHFFGFDLFLRAQMAVDRTTTIYGPPETSERVGGKLRGYTWNLIGDRNIELVVVDLDPKASRKRTTRFHSRSRFLPAEASEEAWDPRQPVFDAGTYQVSTAELYHRTPSLAYVIEEKLTVGVNAGVLRELGLRPAAWINALKRLFLFGGIESAMLDVTLEAGGSRSYPAAELARRLLIPRQRHKIAYATDGAASAGNRGKLVDLIRGADLFFCETCFLEEDRALADETKHFTAAFVGSVAREAGVKKLAPFHFSKRYLGRADEVIAEVSRGFGDEVVRLVPAGMKDGEEIWEEKESA